MRYLAAVAVLALAPSAFAELVANGSFETPTIVGSFNNISGGGTIGAWAVGGNSVDHVGTYWVAFDGTNSVDLSGASAGSVSQTINVTSGTSYLLTFYLSGNPEGGNAVKSLNVTVDSTTTNFTYNTSTFNPTTGSGGNMQWQFQTLVFTAGASTATITFTSQEANPYGPVIDLVSVVPEPSSIALFGLGIAGLGLWRRSRSKRSVATRS